MDAQQIVEAFPFDDVPRYLIRNRDGIYGSHFRHKVTADTSCGSTRRPTRFTPRTALWFWDQEIFDFIGRQLHLAGALSMRDYLLACELK